MPSTLTHLGTQGLISRGLAPGASLPWIYLGCVLPDLPWIVQRLARQLPGVDLAELRLYVVAQATLLGCLVLAAAVSAIAVRWRPVFALLGGGALLHLLLDAVEEKWANGVVLLAPFDWEMRQLGLFWSESGFGVAWTVLAAVWVAWHWRDAIDDDPQLDLRLRRLLIAGGLLAVWLLLPVTLRDSAFRGDVHFVRTLAEVDQRPGRPIELYRAHAVPRPGPDVVESLEREELLLEGLEVDRPRRVSIRGRFEDRHTVRVDDEFLHARGARDVGSYLGLALVAGLWLRIGWRRLTERRAARSAGDRRPSG